MKNIQNIAAPALPPGSSALMKPCVCGHHRFKHVAFERACREAGCKCQFFGEQLAGESTTECTNHTKGNLP